ERNSRRPILHAAFSPVTDCGRDPRAIADSQRHTLIYHDVHAAVELVLPDAHHLLSGLHALEHGDLPVAHLSRAHHARIRRDRTLFRRLDHVYGVALAAIT